MTTADALLVVVIVRETNETGAVLKELQTNPVKLFRATTPDVWKFVDEEVAKLKL